MTILKSVWAIHIRKKNQETDKHTRKRQWKCCVIQNTTFLSLHQYHWPSIPQNKLWQQQYLSFHLSNSCGPFWPPSDVEYLWHLIWPDLTSRHDPSSFRAVIGAEHLTQTGSRFYSLLVVSGRIGLGSSGKGLRCCFRCHNWCYTWCINLFLKYNVCVLFKLIYPR